jgi:N-acetylglucosamine kinase-like BadF-type ATPase
MATYIGVDGGGTKTRLLIQQDAGEPRYLEFDQTIRFLENGFEVGAARFIDLMQGIDGLDINDIASISIGLAGAGLEEEQRRYEQAIKSRLHGLVSVSVQSDSTLSLGAAFPDGPGIIVIAGTGSVAIGRTEDDAVIRVGGWGRLLGDEGSGHVIGLNALKHYARVIDGRDEHSKLFSALNKELTSRLQVDPRELRTAIARSELTPSEFAKLVFDTSDDEISSEILADAADDLAELITTCAGLLHYRGTVYAIGSVIQNPEMMQRVGEVIALSGLSIATLASDAPVHHALRLARSSS